MNDPFLIIIADNGSATYFSTGIEEYYENVARV